MRGPGGAEIARRIVHEPFGGEVAVELAIELLSYRLRLNPPSEGVTAHVESVREQIAKLPRSLRARWETELDETLRERRAGAHPAQSSTPNVVELLRRPT